MLNKGQENALHISVRECHFAIVRKVIEYVRSNNPQDGPEMVRQLINKQNKVWTFSLSLSLSLFPACSSCPWSRPRFY
jgi:hypothetical protein